MNKQYKSISCVHAQKADRYLASLARHFARKVAVEQLQESAHVRFDMGTCLMTVAGTRMSFECIAPDEKALETVKYIVGSHITKYGELQNVTVQWQDSED